MKHSATFVEGHCVQHTVTSVHHDVRRVSRNVKDNPGRHVHGGHVQRLKPGLCHPLSVSLGVTRASVGKTRRSSSATEFVAESVMKDFSSCRSNS